MLNLIRGLGAISAHWPRGANLAHSHSRTAHTAPTFHPLSQVVSGFDQLLGADCMVEAFPQLGLSVLSAPDPLPYISLFSHTIGRDVVVSFRTKDCSTSFECIRLPLALGRASSREAHPPPFQPSRPNPPSLPCVRLTVYDDHRYELEYTQTAALTPPPHRLPHPPEPHRAAFPTLSPSGPPSFTPTPLLNSPPPSRSDTPFRAPSPPA